MVRHRFRSAAESGILAGLPLAVVDSVRRGLERPSWALYWAPGWPSVPSGVRSVLDAGCFFMLLVVGVILVVDLVTNGPGSLLQ